MPGGAEQWCKGRYGRIHQVGKMSFYDKLSHIPSAPLPKAKAKEKEKEEAMAKGKAKEK